MSKDVTDVSKQMPQSVEELVKVNGDLRKQLEEQLVLLPLILKLLVFEGKQLEDKDKQLEDQRKENQALARRIKELEAQASKQ